MGVVVGDGVVAAKWLEDGGWHEVEGCRRLKDCVCFLRSDRLVAIPIAYSLSSYHTLSLAHLILSRGVCQIEQEQVGSLGLIQRKEPLPPPAVYLIG